MSEAVSNRWDQAPHTPRYVRKNARVYDFSLCKLCGAAGFTTGRCETTTCLYCGTVQCMSNGGGRGQCAICHHGFLPGWSGSHAGTPCSYKGCIEPAVGRFPRKGRVCASHGTRILGAGYLAQQLVERDRIWELR